MKKNFWSWVPTDRPWALYPLKANSHSACLNISAQPLPSHSNPSSSCTLSRVIPFDCVRPTARVGGMQVQAGREREVSIVGLDRTLSPLEHPLMGGVLWQSCVLIWLCKCLLQKAIRCNPYPTVERQGKREGSKKEEVSMGKNKLQCNGERVDAWKPKKIRRAKCSQKIMQYFCPQEFITIVINIQCLFTASHIHSTSSGEVWGNK